MSGNPDYPDQHGVIDTTTEALATEQYDDLTETPEAHALDPDQEPVSYVRTDGGDVTGTLALVGDGEHAGVLSLDGAGDDPSNLSADGVGGVRVNGFNVMMILSGPDKGDAGLVGVGTMFFQTSGNGIDGKPWWSDGTNWRDSNGDIDA